MLKKITKIDTPCCLFSVFLTLSFLQSNALAQTLNNFERPSPRPGEFIKESHPAADASNSWQLIKAQYDKEEGMRSLGFMVMNLGPNALLGDPIDPDDDTRRTWLFETIDNSSTGTDIWLSDNPGTGTVTGVMESIFVLLPRKFLPMAKTENGEILVTLTNGEQMVFDQNTRLIKSGVFTESAMDMNPNQSSRKFARIGYSGKGILIRTDRRGGDPRTGDRIATITQNTGTGNGKLICKLHVSKIWTIEGDLRFSEDEDLVKMLNKNCSNKFKL